MPITLAQHPPAGPATSDEGTSPPLGLITIAAHHFVCYAGEVAAALEQARRTLAPEDVSAA